MRTITIEIMDEYADIITFTAIGQQGGATHIIGGGAWEIKDGTILKQTAHNKIEEVKEKTL